MEGECEIDRLLRDGDPTVGWTGDDTLSLWHNTILDRWELWRRGDLDAEATLVCTAPGHRMPGKELLRALAEHDTRHVDVVARVEAANAAHAKAEHDKLMEHAGALGDKLAWALAKDLDEPAPSGKLYSLGGDA